MKTNRRNFLETDLLGSVAAALPLPARRDAPRSGSKPKTRGMPSWMKILRQPVLNRELFASPVIIETLELLRYKDSFCAACVRATGPKAFRLGIAS